MYTASSSYLCIHIGLVVQSPQLIFRQTKLSQALYFSHLLFVNLTCCFLNSRVIQVLTEQLPVLEQCMARNDYKNWHISSEIPLEPQSSLLGTSDAVLKQVLCWFWKTCLGRWFSFVTWFKFHWATSVALKSQLRSSTQLKLWFQSLILKLFLNKCSPCSSSMPGCYSSSALVQGRLWVLLLFRKFFFPKVWTWVSIMHS